MVLRSCQEAILWLAACQKYFSKHAAKAEMANLAAIGWEMRRGHYVKMVHNGIEYGDMQLIAEAYSLMKRS